MTVIDDRFDTDQLGGSNSTDRELIDAVRQGDASAYATLYELYEDSIRRVARRLARDRFEADDVVSEVFANTLRAIQRGGGPRDDFAVYALRSVRNTVAKMRTRTDSARALPTEHAHLDRPADDESIRFAGDVEQAFAELPERFQSVLWSTCIEGRSPTEVADDDLDAGAVASLSNRARRALGRSYLRVHTQRPSRHPECTRVRTYLPGYVQHSAAPTTVRRIESHLRSCTDCQSVRDDMTELNGKLRSAGWWSLIAAAGRQLVASFGGLNAPVIATAAAPIAALIVAGAVVNDHQSDQARETAEAAAAFAAADPIGLPVPVTTVVDISTVAPSTSTAPRPTVAATVIVDDTVEADDLTETSTTVTTTPTASVTTTPSGPDEADVVVTLPGDGAIGGITTLPGTTLDGVVTDVVDVVDTLLNDPANVGGAVATVVDQTTDVVGNVVDDLTDTVDQVTGSLGLDTAPITDVVDDLVDGALIVVDDLTGTVGGVASNLVGTILPGASPTTTTVPAAPTSTTVPGLLPGLIGGLGGLLGG